MTFGRRMIGLRRSLGRVLVLPFLILALAATASAQMVVRGDEPSPPADAAYRAALIDSVTATLNNDYVFEDVAKDMEKHLRSKLRKGEYDALTTIPDFARQLTEDLREVSGDRHLGVQYASDELIQEVLARDEDSDLDRQMALEEQRRNNFEFKKLEILPGNVGYLKFDQFVDAPLAGPTATAAMNFLANTDAIIIDLRENGGGSPSLIQFLTAYFLDETTHLNSFHTRQGDSVHQFWSLPYVPGPKMEDVDLYVLTSRYTFSGAEEFTYNLKNLDRATIVGETTGGGAHPITLAVWPSLNAGMRVPYARAVNPITGTNWEGTGITPHIEVPQEQALDRAHLEALSKLREREEDENRAFTYDWAVEGLRAKLNPVEVDAATLEKYAGEYGPRKLWVEDGVLQYQREDGPVRPATPMSDTLFRFEGLDYFRLAVVLDEEGRPVKLVGHYDDGHTDESPRTDS
jgi:hypothetical protein